MAVVQTFLNFPGNCGEAFEFYKTAFGTDYVGETSRFGEGAPKGTEDMLAHIALPTIGGHVLNGADAPKEMGMNVSFGNNVYIMLEPDSRADTDKLYKNLSAGGQADQPLAEQPWGAYYGLCTDKFGVQWAFNCMAA